MWGGSPVQANHRYRAVAQREEVSCKEGAPLEGCTTAAQRGCQSLTAGGGEGGEFGHSCCQAGLGESAPHNSNQWRS